MEDGWCFTLTPGTLKARTDQSHPPGRTSSPSQVCPKQRGHGQSRPQAGHHPNPTVHFARANLRLHGVTVAVYAWTHAQLYDPNRVRGGFSISHVYGVFGRGVAEAGRWYWQRNWRLTTTWLP